MGRHRLVCAATWVAPMRDAHTHLLVGQLRHRSITVLEPRL